MTPGSNPSRRAALAATAAATATASVAAIGGLAGCLGRVTTDFLPSSNETAAPRAADLASWARCDTRAEPWRVVEESKAVAAESVEAAPGDLPRIESPPARYFCRWPGAPDDCLERATGVRLVSSRAVGADAPIAMTPSTDRLELPGTLTNRTTEPFQTNFHARQIWKRVGGRWYRVYPQMHVQPAMALGPGERLRYCRHLDNDPYENEHLHSIHPDPHDRADTQDRTADGGDGAGGDGVDSGDGGRGDDSDEAPDFEADGTGEDGPSPWTEVVPALGRGEYAFVLFGLIAPPDEVHEAPRTGAAARFTLAGDPLELTTSSHVEDVTVSEGRVTARWTYNDGEWASSRGRFTLRQADAVEHPRPLITEQVLRVCPDTPVRDALALARQHDADVVSLEGKSDGIPAFACLDYPIEYEGRYYAVETETIERLD